MNHTNVCTFPEDGTVSVRNVAIGSDGKTFTQICGYADVPDPEKPGELKVHFPLSPTGDYWVLETDYDNWVSVYACQDILGLTKFEFAWILVRDPKNVTQEIKDKALEAFTSQDISISKFEEIVQTGCTYEDPSGEPECTSE